LQALGLGLYLPQNTESSKRKSPPIWRSCVIVRLLEETMAHRKQGQQHRLEENACKTSQLRWNEGYEANSTMRTCWEEAGSAAIHNIEL
jgi:hypothetical protein